MFGHIRLRAIVFAVVFAGAGLIVAAPAVAATGPHMNLVAGEAKFGSLDAQVRIHAQGDPATGVARGSFFLSEGVLNLQVSGRITCLKVVANTAAAGGVIEQSANPAFVGRGFIQYLQDNGSPGRNDRSDTVFLAAPPTSCPAPRTPLFQLTQGNYVVKQAQ